MLLNYYFLSLLILTSFFVQAAEQQISFEYKKADLGDVAAIVQLINKAAQEKEVLDRLVVLPENHREGAVHHAVEKGRFFVTKHGSRVVAMGKCYTLEGEEKKNTLCDEIRCLREGAMPLEVISTRKYHYTDEEVQQLVMQACDRYPVVYRGGELTDCDYRGQNLNNQLMQKALESVVHGQSSNRMVMVFGVTLANKNRIQAVMRNMQDVMPDTEVLLAQYQAFKPSFNLHSQNEPVLLPESEWIEGRGCVAICEPRQ